MGDTPGNDGFSDRPQAPDRRNAAPVVICYPSEGLPPVDRAVIAQLHEGTTCIDTIEIPPRDARAFEVPAGHLFRIVCVDGPQVGDLNLWNSDDLDEHFYSGKTRQLQRTHLSTGDRLWSCLPALRALATITADSLDWYGFDEDGAGVHDVIGTRCDPYTNALLHSVDYHQCCHSNLVRALLDVRQLPPGEAERHVHDVLNVFMCTGFTRDTHQYFMKASPVRPGDYLELFAEIDLLGALSACPGGDCGTRHSSDTSDCYPLRVEIRRPRADALAAWQPSPRSVYGGNHGLAVAGGSSKSR